MPEHLDRIVLDERPWGRFERFSLNEPTTVKIITVDAAGILSLQRHVRRDELWSVLDGHLTVRVGDTEVAASAGDRFFIPRGVVHRVSAPTESGGRILEVAFGHFDETDIERLEDQYGRD